MYVARFTLDPHADIERGWSGWMGISFSTLRAAAESLLDDCDDLDDKTDDEIESILDAHNFDIRFDEKLGEWRPVHHMGLSCFALEAKTLEAALVEKHRDAVGEGDKTIGKISYVCPVPGDDGWHIFECDDAVREN